MFKADLAQFTEEIPEPRFHEGQLVRAWSEFQGKKVEGKITGVSTFPYSEPVYIMDNVSGWVYQHQLMEIIEKEKP